MGILSVISIIVYLLVPWPKVSAATAAYFIDQNQSMSDGMTLVSQNGTFELGFFSPGDSKSRYLGIWYKNIPIQTVVWVANRENPVTDASSILKINSSGHLVLSQNDIVVWVSIHGGQAKNAVAYLSNSGNFVVRDKEEVDPEVYLWQSFDYPTDTLLPSMKLGWDLRIGLNRRLTAWKSPDDPSPGDLSWGYDVLSNYPESYMMKGEQILFRAGPWNGLYPSGCPELLIHNVFSSKDEIYYAYSLNYAISRLVINQTNYIQQRYAWSEAEQNWRLLHIFPKDSCDSFGICGAYSICNISQSPICQCIKGFVPKFPQYWSIMDWSGGCIRNKTLSCKDKHNDGFIRYDGVKVPQTRHTALNQAMDLSDCRETCLKNCSCTAYANSDVRDEGSGCVMWFDDLIDIKVFTTGRQNLYVRMAASELELQLGRSKKKSTIIVVTIVPVISGMLLLGFCFICKVRRNMNEKSKTTERDQDNGRSEDNLDLPLLKLSTIIIATDNFPIKNKIGQGGFGPVYKGRLVDGQEIAVKKLSKNSGQGMTEFKNEVKLIARLQHRNLVKLLSCCIDGDEKMLVYEYMPNGSLDSFIFDGSKSIALDWPKRFHIILGIARGLLYLHQDSRLRIIHRDLKASNVLLDDKLNPKISDFGMAKTFGADQTEGNTNRVVGTYGYMAPEYAADGLFSIKSDVFSFGILMLEIITSQKNKGFYHADYTLNLSGHAWTIWKEDRALELIDRNIQESCVVSKVLRCIHISLLCVQHHPDDRPTMSTVILMLESEIELAEPKQPGFFPPKVNSFKANPSSSLIQPDATNEITITLLEAR